MTTQQIASFADLPLFLGEPMEDYFCRLNEIIPTSAMAPSTEPQVWAEGEPLSLPASYTFQGVEKATEDLLNETGTAAIVVIRDGKLAYERYSLTGGPSIPWLSMSVAKSFVSALVGIALDEGHIKSLDDPISDYIPVDTGSAYDGVKIIDVLQMSSGARWNEDYSDQDSDAARMAHAMSAGGSLDRLVATAVREFTPGTICRYNSADTQALGSLLVYATGRSLTEYMQEKLVEPLGFTHGSYWLTDATGREAAFAGLNMTGRDFARLGQLYLNQGKWNNHQIISEPYVADSIVANRSHTQPGKPLLSGNPSELGYGYQWWIPEQQDGSFTALGVYNQMIYVQPKTQTVVVKLSANTKYGTSMDEAVNRDMENIAFLERFASYGVSSLPQS